MIYSIDECLTTIGRTKVDNNPEVKYLLKNV